MRPDQEAQARQMRARAVVRKTFGTLWTYAVLLAIFVFAVFPFFWTLAISITDKTVASGISIYSFPASLLPRHLTLSNFVEVFNTFKLGKYLWNSVAIAGLTVVGTLLVSALAAYPLARLNFPLKNLIFGAILATLVLPQETSFIVNVLTLRDLHILGTYWGVVVPIISTAFGIFVMRQAYLAIPATLLEAARIDGASEMQILSRIMIPLSLPSLTALGIFTLVGIWNTYFWPSLALITNQDLYPLSVAVLTLKGQFNYDPFNVAAGAMVMMLPILLVFLLAQRFFMRGLEGAVKG
ncbi:MAG: carbohydrate ABC transporter permease [Thermaceae bacterium]|nr:carbohydrate ABC transporter permease [Thermaceae bacterium]